MTIPATVKSLGSAYCRHFCRIMSGDAKMGANSMDILSRSHCFGGSYWQTSLEACPISRKLPCSTSSSSRALFCSPTAPLGLLPTSAVQVKQGSQPKRYSVYGKWLMPHDSRAGGETGLRFPAGKRNPISLRGKKTPLNRVVGRL